MREFFWKYDFEIKLIFSLLFLAGAIDFVYLNKSLLGSSVQPIEVNQSKEPQLGEDACGPACQKVVQEEIETAVASLSARSKSVPVVISVPASVSQTTFVPFGGSASTKSTDWTDVSGSDVSIKIEDYGNDPYVDWNASIKIANGNGTAYARLYDVTHGIAVDNSEISTSSGDFAQVSSGRIRLWSGNNLYRVQIKSLNTFEVFFNSGRIKIVSKASLI